MEHMFLSLHYISIQAYNMYSYFPAKVKGLWT